MTRLSFTSALTMKKENHFTLESKESVVFVVFSSEMGTGLYCHQFGLDYAHICKAVSESTI